jgi:hypothetical protein
MLEGKLMDFFLINNKHIFFKRLLKHKNRNKMSLINYSIALNPYLFDSVNFYNKNIEDKLFHSKTIRLLNLFIYSFKEIFKTSSFENSLDDRNRKKNNINEVEIISSSGSQNLKEILMKYNKDNDSFDEYRRELKLYSSKNYTTDLKSSKTKTTKTFTIKTPMQEDQIENLNLKIDEYLKMSPKIYLNDSDEKKFLEIFKLVDYKLPFF